MTGDLGSWGCQSWFLTSIVVGFCRDCVKAYHPECVGKEETTEDTEDKWFCGKFVYKSLTQL